ncbi:Bug family tripartite tricarboxylate transporter substrate binding protein [Pseudolabrys taiwanensis]|nr:tripartite tricarboxylate transporter substrate binding protein [Pseudolabrys taiwanensis]
MSLRKIFAACAMMFVFTAAQAQPEGYPSHTIKMVVPFPAGGATDIIARLVADRLGDDLGTRIIVENKGGAGGNVGTASVATAEPDGHTILFSASGPLAVNKILYKNLPYDPEKDFEPLSLVAKLPNVLVVNPKVIPVKTVSEFIAYVKARPGQINYSSIGVGSSQHLAGVLFERITKTKMNHVPYRAATNIVVDMMSGQVPASFQLIPNVWSRLGAGDIRAIAVASRERSLALPNVPTMAEQGLPEFESSAWFGLLVPKGTPKPIVDRLSGLISKIMADPTIRKRMIEIGADPAQSTPEEFRALISSEVAKWRTVIKDANITIE